MDSRISPKKKSQEKLAGFIKHVHARLRKNFQLQEEESAWKEHTSNASLLQQYASAMKILATEHWQACKDSRISWCQAFIKSYFQDGLLAKLIAKDARVLDFHSSEAVEVLSCCGVSYTSLSTLADHRSGVCSELQRRASSNTIALPLTAGIRLLDVGSCYAPFSIFPEIDCLSIDLHPASEDVLQCDFLEVPVRPISNFPCTGRTYLLDGNKVTSLKSETYHAVVFSLLLEYMPSHQQRWRCCTKAHQLLVHNGVLIIVTPDSNHQSRHSVQMGDWRRAIESIGFKRCAYEKLRHLHCMAFRKLSSHSDSGETTHKLSHLLYIPQDKNMRLELSSTRVASTRMSCQSDCLTDFTTLPFEYTWLDEDVD